MSDDGKKGVMNEIRIPSTVVAEEIITCLDDLCHKWATLGHPDIVIISQ